MSRGPKKTRVTISGDGWRIFSSTPQAMIAIDNLHWPGGKSPTVRPNLQLELIVEQFGDDGKVERCEVFQVGGAGDGLQGCEC